MRGPIGIPNVALEHIPLQLNYMMHATNICIVDNMQILPHFIFRFYLNYA
ncbi:hypothetical protein Fmac_020692 [Flemingia macrophylla]|uniref:Uncharacterized protein n=1 Tax=Flemingia macrophylla TaxID=520843 RepID=A0ABD1LUT3_9FABA